MPVTVTISTVEDRAVNAGNSAQNPLKISMDGPWMVVGTAATTNEDATIEVMSYQIDDQADQQMFGGENWNLELFKAPRPEGIPEDEDPGAEPPIPPSGHSITVYARDTTADGDSKTVHVLRDPNPDPPEVAPA